MFEEFKLIVKENRSFMVGNYGTIRILDKDGKIIEEKTHPGQFSQTGGHGNRTYLNAYGYYAHRLVAEAFIGKIPKGYEVNHINGDSHDNRVDNLAIVTPAENKKHAYEMALSYKPTSLSPLPELLENIKKHKAHKRAKRWAILDLDLNIIADFENSTEAAKYLGVSRQTISNNRKNGRAIKGRHYSCRITDIDSLREGIS